MIQYVNKSGFTLISALVYAAIITTVALGIATIISQSVLSVNSVQARINQELLVQAIHDRLISERTCSAALNGTTFNYGQARNTITITASGTSTNAAANQAARANRKVSGSISSGQQIRLNLAAAGIGDLVPAPAPQGASTSSLISVPNYWLRTRDLRLMNADSKGPVPNNPGATLYSVDVIGQFDAEKRVAGAATFQPVLLAQIYLTVAGTTITNCEGTQNYPVIICSAEGGESKIYLPQGLQGGFHPDRAAPSGKGCVSLSAFQGQRGETGQQGPAGIPGPTPNVIVNPGPITFVPLPGPGPGPGPGPVTPPVVLPPVTLPPFTPPSPKWSDFVTKKSVEDFEYGLKELVQIRPVWFEYNGYAGTSAGERHVGVIAQELEVIAPNMVEKVNVNLKPTDKQPTEVRRVYYHQMTAMLLNSVQEQQEQINRLSRELKQLKEREISRRERTGHQQ